MAHSPSIGLHTFGTDISHPLIQELFMNMKGKPQEVSINMTLDVLGAKDGVDKLIAELDKLYKKDSSQSLFEAIDDFAEYRRGDGEYIDNYILEFQEV